MLPEYRDLLEKVYEMTKGNEVKYVGENDLGKELGQEAEETKRIVSWLLDEGLLNRRSIGNVELTHVGIKQIGNGETLGK
jgi:Mn-dependent DtxR family transcriptional regulator